MNVRQEFNYIVVGAGWAGCVLAARLSEDPGARVALIETGGLDDAPEISMPVAFQTESLSIQVFTREVRVTQTLRLDVFEAPPKQINPTFLAAATEGGLTWPPTTTTLISGACEAVLLGCPVHKR
jgi:choline dehydrogenase-like flavoprotein